MLKKIIVISAHPDDETLGAGGTLLKIHKEGKKIYWLNISDMKTEYGYKSKTVAQRSKEIKKVAKHYGFTGTFNLRLKPTGLENYPVRFLIEKITEVFSKVMPDTVILPFKNDIHSDHKVVFEAGFACTKSFRAPYIKKVMMMEVLSETDFARPEKGFLPNCFVDITKYLDDKLKIMKIYSSEHRKHPFPRSLEGLKALATIRGTSAGCKYAESFIILKEID